MESIHSDLHDEFAKWAMKHNTQWLFLSLLFFFPCFSASLFVVDNYASIMGHLSMVHSWLLEYHLEGYRQCNALLLMRAIGLCKQWTDAKNCKVPHCSRMKGYCGIKPGKCWPRKEIFMILIQNVVLHKGLGGACL